MADINSPSLPAQAGQFVLLHSVSTDFTAEIMLPSAGLVALGVQPDFPIPGVNARILFGGLEFLVTETPAQIQQAILDQAVQGFERILPKMMVATLRAACMIPLVQEAAENNPDFLLGLAQNSGILSAEQIQELEAEAAKQKARRSR